MGKFRPRFDLGNRTSSCAASASATCEARTTVDYEDVRALQLGSGGRILAVLHGNGIIDSWDLRTSTLLGRLRLGRAYTAMCHDGDRFLLVRPDRRGPAIDGITA